METGVGPNVQRDSATASPDLLGRPNRAVGTLVLGAIAVLAFALCARGAANRPLDRLRAVPEPATERFEPVVRQHLVDERRALEEVLARGPAGGSLGEAFGRLGRVYYAYDLLEPAAVCFLNARDTAPADPRWHYYLAVVAQRGGEFERSLSLLDAALALEPSDRAALVRAGNVSVELGRLRQAEHYYRNALELDGARAAALAGLGRIAAIERRPKEAIDLFERALAIQPSATSIHHQLGMAYRTEGDLDAAGRHFELNTGGALAFEDPLMQEVRGLIRSAKIYIEIGVGAARQGRYEEAIAAFNQAVSADPRDAVAFFHLGLAELRNGQRAEAISHLKRSVELDSDMRDARRMLGSLATEDGRLIDAEAQYRGAHEIDPEDLETHLDWVTTLSRLDRTEAARAELGAILESDEHNPRARLLVGVLFARQGRAAEAEVELARVIDGSRADSTQKAEAWHHRSLLREGLGDAVGAEAGYRAGVELAPEDPVRLEALALFLGRAARFVEAAEIYQRALAVDGERSSAHFGRAMALLLGRRFVEARTALAEATARLPGDLSLAHLMARVLAASPDRLARDGTLAYRLALRVHRNAPSPGHAETVAMALAELGRFDEAIEWQSRALAEVDRVENPQRALEAGKRLEAYRRGEPSREPWLASGG